MTASATCRHGLRLTRDAACGGEATDGGRRIAFSGYCGKDPALSHPLDEAFATTGGEDDVHVIERMVAGPVELMHAELLGQLEPRYFNGVYPRFRLENQKTSGATGMAGHCAKVLA